MALTDQQRTDCQRWMGYGITARIGYGRTVPVEPLGLDQVLDDLTSIQEETLVTRFLDPLSTLEDAILSAADNLDTLKAGPWEANPTEVADRRSLYKAQRRELCAFLGFEPGPSLGSGGIALMRG